MPIPAMPILGAHKSIARGFDKAVERAVASGCQCLQLFTKNNSQWRAKPIGPEEAARFRQAVEQSGMVSAIAHDSYLINLASPDPVLWKKSVSSLIDEVRRADAIGPGVCRNPSGVLYRRGQERRTAEGRPGARRDPQGDRRAGG